MSKYGAISISLQCRLEVDEMKEILKKYNVSEEDIQEIEDMIKEAYFQFSKECAAGRVLEKYVKDMTLKDFMRELALEEQKYPFDPDGEELEDEEE